MNAAVERKAALHEQQALDKNAMTGDILPDA